VAFLNHCVLVYYAIGSNKHVYRKFGRPKYKSGIKTKKNKTHKNIKPYQNLTSRA